MADAGGVRAVVTLDCREKLRVHYLVPSPVDDALVAGLAVLGAVFVQRFSQSVRGALDHVVIAAPTLRATAALGGDRVTVTWAKRDDGAVDTAAVDGIFAARYGAAPVVVRALDQDR